MRREIHTTGKERRTLNVWSEKTRPPEVKRQQIIDWLDANGIEPNLIALEPITLEFVPGCAGSMTSCSGVCTAPWWITFTQRYTDTDGKLEPNAVTGGLAEVQRTVPLTIAPPLSLVPEWERESQATHVENDPPPKLARLSEVQG